MIPKSLTQIDICEMSIFPIRRLLDLVTNNAQDIILHGLIFLSVISGLLWGYDIKSGKASMDHKEIASSEGIFVVRTLK